MLANRMSTATTDATSSYQAPLFTFNQAMDQSVGGIDEAFGQNEEDDEPIDNGFVSARVSEESNHGIVEQSEARADQQDQIQFLLDNKEAVLRTLHSKFQIPQE